MKKTKIGKEMRGMENDQCRKAAKKLKPVSGDHCQPVCFGGIFQVEREAVCARRAKMKLVIGRVSMFGGLDGVSSNVSGTLFATAEFSADTREGSAEAA